MTVSAASMRKDIKENDHRDMDHDAGDVTEEGGGEVEERQEQVEGMGDLPPSSFRSVALVGAPRWVLFLGEGGSVARTYTSSKNTKYIVVDIIYWCRPYINMCNDVEGTVCFSPAEN